MAEQQQEQVAATGGGAGHAPAHGAARTSHPATGMVEAMLARGESSALLIASLLQAHPAAQAEILALLHATLGNAFVHEVTAAKSGETKPGTTLVGPVRVTASSLRVRSSASASNARNVVGRLPRGSVVTATGQSGKWLQIEHAGGSAFVHADYVTSATATPEQATALAPTQAGEEDDGGREPEVAAPAAPLQLADAGTPVAAPQHPAPSTPAPAPAPTPAPTPAPVQQAEPAHHDALGGTYKGVFDRVYSTGTQKAQVWVSAGGVSATPNIYLHFHGHRTDYDIDDDLAWHESGRAPKKDQKLVDVGGSGHRAAKQAMAAAANKNTIVILPQGVLGEGSGGKHEGGYQADLEALGLGGFLDKILKPLAKDLGVAQLSPGNISLGGHSSGGYTGFHSAMRRLEGDDKALADHITDVTLYDASYGGGAHLDETRAWAFKGKPGKNVRLVNGWAQQTTKTEKHAAHDLWAARFGEVALTNFARAKGMTVRKVGDAGHKLDAETTVMEHNQVINKDGAVQCDVLIVMFSKKGGGDHEALRDRTIDDAIMSIGEGAAGNAKFGHHDKGHLKDEAAQLERDREKLDHDEDHHDDHAHADHAHGDDHHQATDPHALQPAHVQSDDRDKPEPVKLPPKAATPPPKAEKAKQVNEKDADLRKRLYDPQTGIVSAEKLGRHHTVKVKGKKVNIDLTDEQYEFKQKVYRLATSKVKPGKLYGGVDDKDLDPVPGTDQKIRKTVLPDLTSLLAAARAAGHDIWVGSGYRPPEQDFEIWSRGFDTMYLWETKKEREKRWPDDPFGDEAAAYVVDQIKGRKAPPGSSNHSNGIAVDFHARENGKELPISYNNQKAWRASKIFAWLTEHAKDFHFKNLATEAWHYDHKP
ncbi:MAG TPA: D-alanyl-D-alanine carboxypeptidase family protein [Kofleriaceae bacterium]|nr:D-alanyl-D-alanine carboxypeptidase family protein [Kofleriaceae bacterium]